MVEVSLPQEVIEQDRAWERATESATESLAQLRWHWTLDESNPIRVSLKAYARDTDKAFSVIHKYAHGYATWTSDRACAIGLGECIERASISSEKQAVADAIADAYGLTFQTVTHGYRDDVQQVRDVARRRAEEKGTSVEEEAPAIAKTMARISGRGQQVREDRLAHKALRYSELEGYLVSMLRYGKKAAQLASQLNWDDEEQTLLQHTIDQVRRMLSVIDERIAGTETVDWDSELSAIMEGIS